jgi:hypothetical protein
MVEFSTMNVGDRVRIRNGAPENQVNRIGTIVARATNGDDWIVNVGAEWTAYSWPEEALQLEPTDEITKSIIQWKQFLGVEND